MDNEKNCDKYEALFVFRSDEELNEHIKNCPECRLEHERQMKISALVKEAAPAYLKREEKRKMKLITKAACCFFMFVGLTSFYTYNVYSDNDFQVSSSEDSYIESNMGLPTDDYGFLEL
ncbi:hypothetical protein II906_00760 [bacterium]|nr:hypothetical protein [bacterium]